MPEALIQVGPCARQQYPATARASPPVIRRWRLLLVQDAARRGLRAAAQGGGTGADLEKSRASVPQ